MILVYMIALSVGIGYARGGRLKHYLEQPLSLVCLPIAAFAIEALIPAMGKAMLGPAVVVEYALLLVFILANRRYKPIWLVGAGFFLNACVIFANGFRMPVTPVVNDPVFAAFADRVRSGELLEYVLVGWDAPLWFLGDTIPVRRLVPGIASAGDFVMAAGMYWLIQHFMRPVWPRRRRKSASRAAQ
jgi:hypothetical protein